MATTNVKTTAVKPTTKKVAEVKKTATKTTAPKVTTATVKAAPKATKTTVEVKKVEVKKAKTATKTVKENVARGNRRKVMRGIVTSNKMDKTGVVEITRKVPHPLYKKVVTKTTRFKFHDEKNECSIGDTIEIMETRPLSKDKYFRLVRIIEKVK